MGSGRTWRVIMKRALPLALLLFAAANANAQRVFPESGLPGRPPPVTPIEWKWNRLDKDTYFYFGGVKNGPLVLALPAAPGDGLGGFNEYLERYLVDEGYAVGVLNWRGDFSRTANPSVIVNRAFADLARVRASGQGKFDPNRIVLFGTGEGAFLALLLSADTIRLQAANVPHASICAVVLPKPMNLDATNPDSYLAQRQFSGGQQTVDLSPLHYARSAPPTMILDIEGERRGETAATVLKSAGATVLRTTYAPFDENNERTYFGWPMNPATLRLGEFLKTYCPAKKS